MSRGHAVGVVRRGRALTTGLVIGALASVLGPALPARADHPVTVVLTAAAGQVSYGDEVILTATVSVGGVPAPYAYVDLTRTGADGQQSLIDVDATGQDGRVTFSDAPTVTSTYVATASFQAGEPDYHEATGNSAPVAVAVAFAVTPRASPVAVPPGGALTLTALVEPAAPGSALVEQRFGTGPWQSLGEHPVAADGRLTVSLGRRSALGTHTFRVTRLGDTLRVTGVAEAASVVTVTGPGSPTAWRPLGGTKASPARWGTCRIGYRVNPANMPAHGRADLTEAMRRLQQVSGIRFRYLGTTNLVPYAGDSRAGVNKITVAWSSPRATRGLLGPGVGGVGGTSWSSWSRIKTGFVVLNTAFSREAPAGFGEGSPHGLVLMHELGHVVGLDHAGSRSQVMYGAASLPAAIWGAGDRRGLARLGRAGGCR